MVIFRKANERNEVMLLYCGTGYELLQTDKDNMAAQQEKQVTSHFKQPVNVTELLQNVSETTF